ncbi:MAG: DUF3253 domain-containing protein [Pseudomonadota bacterium]
MATGSTLSTNDGRVRDLLLTLAAERGTEKTYCPSEAARRLWPEDWRDHMDDVRRVAALLIAERRLVATQRGDPVDPVGAKGPIRLGLPCR